MNNVITSVSSLIRRAIKELDTTDRYAIVRHVISQIEPEDYELALESLILDRIPQEFGMGRRAGRMTLVTADLSIKGGTAEPEPQVFLDDDFVPPLRVNNTKRDAIRDAYFNQFIPIDGRVKRLGELTAQDCRIASNVRRDLASKNKAIADEFDRLAELIERNGKETLGEVSISEVQSVLRKALD